MKKKLLIVALLALTLGACSNDGVSNVRKDDKIQSMRDYDSVQGVVSPKRKVVIAEFKNQTRFGSRRLGSSLTDVITTELVKSNRFIVLEREDLSKVMQEINFSNTLGQGQLASERKFQDADYVITGAITKYSVNTTGNKGIVSSSKTQRAEISFDMKMINVRTGEVVLSDQGEGVSDVEYGTTLGIGSTGGYDEGLEQEAFRAAAINVMDNIIKTVDKTPWMANVAKVSGNKLYINAGQKSNVEIGTKLGVYKQGEKIEFNGKFLGFEENKVGEAKVVDYLGEDAAILEYKGETFNIPGVVKLMK
ncbi:penicillin-binding protein activator LpoB [Fusobacteria bacterium ZRK30]|nr:penicillin-binding protein activator LpoB [Fusobacteria bacterium ZRK30]